MLQMPFLSPILLFSLLVAYEKTLIDVELRLHQWSILHSITNPYSYFLLHVVIITPFGRAELI